MLVCMLACLSVSRVIQAEHGERLAAPVAVLRSLLTQPDPVQTHTALSGVSETRAVGLRVCKKAKGDAEVS